MYAIINRRTRKWLYGTDFRHRPYTQRTSGDKAMLFETRDEANAEYKRRMCGKSYEVVAVRLEELELKNAYEFLIEQLQEAADSLAQSL